MERRLAAILAIDVVGYSRLTEADEEGTLGRLKTLRRDLIDPTIAEHHGRVAKLMGDGALVEFGSVVDAVRCAIKIQRDMAARNAYVPQMERIEFRIGINLGDIVVEEDDIYGDGVNVAARLEGLADAGGICLSGTAFDQVKTKFDVSFEFLGEQQVKNLSERVRTYRVLLDATARSKGLGAKPKSQWQRPVAAAGVAVLLAFAGVLTWWRPWAPHVEPASVERMDFPLPDQPSIAVLPFTNMSDDAEQEYFADGITEDLITDLSKVSGFFVIARNSTFSYKGQRVKVRQVAEELGVRYVLEGSVRRAGDQVRINAQLIDATTGRHLWAERYDGVLANVFALQDKVTRNIVLALKGHFSPGDKRTVQNETKNAQAYDSFLKGWAHFQKRTPEHYARAVKYFERAVQLDPDYARAFAALAWIYWNGRYGGWYVALGIGPDEAKRRAEEYLERAMAHPTPLAHQVASSMSLWRGRYEDAIAEAERAIDLDANDASSLVALAEVLIWNGAPREAIPLIDRARRLDPHNEAEYAYLHGMAQFGMDQFPVAAASLERALELNPDLWSAQTLCGPCVFLVSAYGYLERARDVEGMVQRLRRSYPEYLTTINPYWFPYREPANFERLIAGLRKAGLPV